MSRRDDSSYEETASISPYDRKGRAGQGLDHGALRMVALFEAAKGALVLIAGFGVLSLLHRDIGAIAESLVAHLHLNPASRLPRVFIDAAERADGKEIWFALGAGLYSAVRFIEAAGLWFHRRWAEWFAAASGAIYVPFEIRGLLLHPGWLGAGILAVNIAIVVVLLRALRARPV